MTTAADRIAKRIRPELEAAAASENLAAATAHVTRALEILRPFGPLRHKRIPSVKAPGKTKEERREERNTRAAEIRAEVMKRADGRCEWCQRDGFVLEWAHVIDGNGSRRAHESVETTAAVCADCHHRGWHGSGPRRDAALRSAKEWAIRLGFREAMAAIDKKIAKSNEARAACPF